VSPRVRKSSPKAHQIFFLRLTPIILAGSKPANVSVAGSSPCTREFPGVEKRETQGTRLDHGLTVDWGLALGFRRTVLTS
jgi:hypothetical protein